MKRLSVSVIVGQFQRARHSSCGILDLARAATKLAHILRERNGNELERLSHRRIDVNQVNEVISGGPKA